MRLLPTSLLLCLVLAACGRDDAATPASSEAAQANTDAAMAAAGAPEDAPGEPELPPLPTGDFRIASVMLGRAVDAEGQVREAISVFKPTDKVHAAVIGIGGSTGLTLSASWTAPDGSQIAKAGQSLAPTAPTVTTFAIAQPDPWPAGEYKVDIAINDRIVETARFRVE